MAISLQSIKKGVQAQPPIICMYGDEGLGKTSFAAGAPNPIFIFTENGQGNLDIDNWKVETFEEVMTALVTLLEGDHNYKTVVIDSLDWFEPMLWGFLTRDRPLDEKGNRIKDINDYGYGKGYGHAIEYWGDFIDLVSRVRNERDMAIIFIAHSTKAKISPPDGDSYDAWTLKLQNGEKHSARDKMIEYCDAIFFAKCKDARTDDKTNPKKSRSRAIGSGERVVYTEKRPAWDAKNRFSLPAQINVATDDWSDVWEILSAKIPWFRRFDAPADAVITPAPVAAPAVDETAVADQAAPVSATPKFIKKA